MWLTGQVFDRAGGVGMNTGRGNSGARYHKERAREEGSLPPSFGLAMKASFSARKGNRLAYLAAKP